MDMRVMRVYVLERAPPVLPRSNGGCPVGAVRCPLMYAYHPRQDILILFVCLSLEFVGFSVLAASQASIAAVKGAATSG